MDTNLWRARAYDGPMAFANSDTEFDIVAISPESCVFLD